MRNYVTRVYEGAAEANVPFLASGLTFDALLAAFPLALLVLSLVGHLLSAGAGAAQVEIGEYVHKFLPRRSSGAADPFSPVVTIIERVVHSRSALSVYGLPLFVWFSTRLFGSLRTTLNEVFDTEETRSWFRGKLTDISLVLVTGALFVLSTALNEGIQVIAVLGKRFGLGFFAFFGTQVLALVSLVGLFVVIFRFVPSRGLRWDTALIAALTCTIGFQLAKFGLSFYFDRFVQPNRIVTDATVAGVLIFVGWTYYMAYVFLIGSQIAQVYELRRRQKSQRAMLGE